MGSSRSRTAVLSHPLNLLLLGSGALSAVWVADWRPLAVVFVAELLWLVGAPIANRRRRPERMTSEIGHRALLRKLDEDMRRRYLELTRLGQDLRRLADANPSLTAVGLELELDRVDGLVSAWLQTAAVTSERRAILDSASSPSDDATLAVEHSERELRAVEDALETARDEVMTMSTPESLRSRIDGLKMGVEAAERTLRSVRELEAASSD